MSTKNLARTVIEGGRNGWNRWLRRHSNGVHRAAERVALSRTISATDPDAPLMPRRRPVRPSFSDKLSPAERWLERQAGRPWDDVRGELFTRFDTRTTPGRHIVFCHMLPWVEDDRWFVRRPLTIDEHGVLRLRAPEPRWRRLFPKPLPRPQAELERWLAGRKIGARGDVLFWFVPTPAGAYRQERRLDATDAALWRSIPHWFRRYHDAFEIPPRTEERH